MPIFNVCGTNYQYPNNGDKPWGTIHIAWAAAVSNCVTSVQTQVSTISSNLFTNPMLADGDLIFQNATVPARLPVGADGDVLTVQSGLPVWVTPGAATVPVGAILPFYDFGTLGLPSGFVWCDGNIIVAPGSPIDGNTTPDLSGAYICGFGTLGGGDIGSAAFTAVPIGNANHQIALNHTHTGPSHTHSTPNHTHGNGDLHAQIALNQGFDGIEVNHVSGIGSWTPDAADDIGSSVAPGGANTVGVNVGGTTSSDGASTTGSGGTGNTSSSLSANTNIQPLTQQVRFIMKT